MQQIPGKYAVAEVDESDADGCNIPVGSTGVSFSNPRRQPIEFAALRRAVDAQPGIATVERLVIDETSLMVDLSAARWFPRPITSVMLVGTKLTDLDELTNLKQLRIVDIDILNKQRTIEPLARIPLSRLTVRITSPADIGVLSRCSVSESLRLQGWPELDLRSVSKVPSRSLTVATGVLATTMGVEQNVYDLVMLMGLPRLESVASLRTTKLHVDECNRLDINTVGDVAGLAALSLISIKDITSIEFVRRCTDLEWLSFAASKVSANLAPLAESPSLRKVWIPSAKNADVSAIALRNPRLTISNGKVAYRQGHPIRPSDYTSTWERSRG